MCSIQSFSATQVGMLRKQVQEIRENYHQTGSARELPWSKVAEWIDNSGKSAYTYQDKYYGKWARGQTTTNPAPLLQNIAAFVNAHAHLISGQSRRLHEREQQKQQRRQEEQEQRHNFVAVEQEEEQEQQETRYGLLRCCTVLYCPVLLCTAVYCSVLVGTVPCRAVPYRTVAN